MKLIPDLDDSLILRGRDSSVGIATRYGPWGPPNLLYKEYRVYPAGKAAEAWR